jgi:hypothetical protein
MNADELSYLRYYVTQLVRIWAGLSLIRNGKATELTELFRDLCSDKLRIMLHEFATKKSWTLGFAPDGNPRYDRLFERLRGANKWFEGYKNALHYRNCSGAHMQSLDRADHMFQHFGYGGEREWKHLTHGVAACVAMMKLLDGKKNQEFWRKIRVKVAGVVDDSFAVNVGGEKLVCDLPIGVEALLQSYKLEKPLLTAEGSTHC